MIRTFIYIYYALYKMYIIGGELYEDEEIIGFDPYYTSIYEQPPDDYIYEDEYDQLSFALQDKLQMQTVIISVA